MKVYDAFPFFNELDLLRVRFVEHAPFVDHFLIVEADRTHTGHPKPFYFDVKDPRFAEFAHKILSHRVQLEHSPASPWVNENYQRNAIASALNFDDDDILLISDADELISRHHWPGLLDRTRKQRAVAIQQQMFYYAINLLVPERWTRARMVTAGFLREDGLTPTQVRLADVPATDEPCGWHFSYLGSAEKIQEKLRAFSHQEYNHPQWNSERAIRQAIANQTDLFGRFEQCARLPVDETWPLEMWRNPLWNEYICRPPWLPTRILSRGVRAAGRLASSLRTRLARQREACYGARDIEPASDRVSRQDSASAGLIDRIRKAYPPEIDIDEWNRAVACLLEAFRQVDGWFSTENCVDLFETVVNGCPPGGTVVEVGSWKGRSGVVCSHAAAVRGGRLFCVDHWRGNETEGNVHISVRMAREANIFAIFEDNMRRYARQNYRALRGDSAQIGKNWPEECPIDVFFLDAGHDFQSVLADLQSWVPHVRPGGLVCGDDWNHDERDDLGGSVRRAFQVHFGCTHPNLGISGRFWRHRLSVC